MPRLLTRHAPWWLFLAAVVLTVAVYVPGLPGPWVFDDFPNIVHNQSVQPEDASIASLSEAALSSPSSRFKRPLASLSFAANYLASGLNPSWWKLTNLVIHLLNGLLVFLLARRLLVQAAGGRGVAAARVDPATALRSAQDDDGDRTTARDGDELHATPRDDAVAQTMAHDGDGGRTTARDDESDCTAPRDVDGARAGRVAALIAGAWMLLPINLTAVLYVVQRMESLANLFVLLGLIGYVAARQRMLAGRAGLSLAVGSLLVPTALGLLVKETAILLPLYAFLIEWLLFGFRRGAEQADPGSAARKDNGKRDRRVLVLFGLTLLLPLLLGMLWIVPHVLEPAAWARRDFSLVTRLLSEARIVVDYIGWTLVPTPQALSFYHDQFLISSGLLKPWTTLASLVVIAALVVAVFVLRRRAPLVALGIALFLGCHSLTATILPLELIFEHRNYFASFGLVLALVPLFTAPRNTLPLNRAPRAALAMLGIWWVAMTAFTAWAWGDRLRLAVDFAARAPQSPRAQYELGRTYLLYGEYDADSPFTANAYQPLEVAAALPGASILPEQALIMMNARIGRPLKDAWWESMLAKLKARKSGVQDVSALGALTKCVIRGDCPLPEQRMVAAFEAALSHPRPSARLQAVYGDYAWNKLKDYGLGLAMTLGAIRADPSEPAYHISVARMQIVLGQPDKAREQVNMLEQLNYGGRLDAEIAELRTLLPQP